MSIDLENDLLILLYDVARHMRTYVDQRAQTHRMTRAQMIILARLERQPDVSQNELAAIAEVAPMTIVRLVDRLEELGLVKRCTDPDDRRTWRLHLTRAAEPILREIKHSRARLHSLMTSGIDEPVLAAMVVGLQQMKHNLDNERQVKASAPGAVHA